jgi:NitT/TauT family transport system ATP-binding protein
MEINSAAASRESTDASPVSELAINVQGVGKTFATKSGSIQALEDVSFVAESGAFVTIVGPSGCGKTTLLKMLSGLQLPSEGTIEVFGEQVRTPIAGVGMVFQAPVLLKWRTVLDNVLFPIEILRRNKNEYRDKAREILHLVGLEGFEDRHPKELSGGMQQRVSLARALIHDPQLLLMDEPFGALDQLTREQMNFELMRIWSETHKTTVLITHSIEEAVFLADRVIVLTARPGRIGAIIDVDLPRPRTRSFRREMRFVELVDRIGALLGVIPDDEAEPSSRAASTPTRMDT